ncbi:MAG: tRNA (adenosine(37)-N6)-threonylcarbamoyltransferase complex dimerization subunit type 1 TsaB [Acidobacteria bacterium]|nr:tRNA (adenosine(37)-N6)-threonylcarbamoyltransferase complex dimerization subunit type 1 TsaB [Acidobacteriota bacterium]
MVVLALETVSRAGSLALWLDGVCEALRGNPTRSHAERLPGDMLDMLEARGLSLADVTLLAVVTGPGSFTGLRVGVAAVQGLALAGHIRAIGIPTLDALVTTWRLEHDGTAQVAACLDGQRGEVFFTAIDLVSGHPLEACPTLVAPGVARPDEAAARLLASVDPTRRLVIVGDGAIRYADVFRARFPDAEMMEAPRPLAEAAAVLAAARADQAGAPHALRAIYLRRPDVEIARDRTERAAGRRDTAGWTVRRAATAADLAAVEQLQQKTFTNPWNADSIRWELENTDVARLYLLQDEDGKTVAYCACWVVFDELHINSLAVDPAWRRRGVARHLLRHVMAEAAAGGATSATLEVRASNEPARQLYEGLAFRVEGVRRDYYRDPREDALILWNRRLT